MLEVRPGLRPTARAKGLAERVVIFRHMLRNALIPPSVLGPALAGLLVGSFIIERMFSFPVSARSLSSRSQPDYSMIMAQSIYGVPLTANLAVEATCSIHDQGAIDHRLLSGG